MYCRSRDRVGTLMVGSFMSYDDEEGWRFLRRRWIHHGFVHGTGPGDGWNGRHLVEEAPSAWTEGPPPLSLSPRCFTQSFSLSVPGLYLRASSTKWMLSC